MEMISIITINFNSYDSTVDLLCSLKRYLKREKYDFEVIVVDNASDNQEAEMLKDMFPWAFVINSSENLGFSGGNNLGVKYARGDYYFFINNDTVINEDIVPPLLLMFHEMDNIGAVSPIICDYDTKKVTHAGVKEIDKYLIHINPEVKIDSVAPIHSFYLQGASIMISKSVFELSGGWPDVYFLYDEELDFCFSIKKLGYKLYYNPKSVIYHKGCASTKKESPLVYYYQTRNRLLLYKRNLKGSIFLLSFLRYLIVNVLLAVIRHMLLRQCSLALAIIRGANDFFLSRFYKSNYY
ncbi:glycosyltransferase family 2 protein [uncultured Parabacteroides sp.]|uniref:glycosyltransferase family 2 protein n=1 Tax=uncultured Parabacteroides sp. TaxID=512312 RepID=UPI0028063CFD|nr:glycosyltransferase family 2 protein [uncultured Parabacteroides sp.]